MILSPAQQKEVSSALALGLSTLYREPPLTATEWADRHFYLSSESSYQEGKWKTEPFQVAILNAMGNDQIQVLNLIKSARIGYTKMLVANIGYKVQHKKRNILTYSPTDNDSDELMKRHVETMIRDVPVVLELSPWYGKKHRDSTMDAKRFANSKMLWCLGGKASRNYREKSPDEVIYDELSKFDQNIDGEGAPVSLGDKRLEGSTFPKSIRGSTPKVRGQCQIEKAAEESAHLMRFHLRCPHCDGEQHLKWGGPDCDFGIKFSKSELGEAEAAWYECEHCHQHFEHHQMVEQAYSGRWICERTGYWTRNSYDWFNRDDEVIPAPRSVSFHIWTAYSTFTTWQRIVTDFLKVKDDLPNLIAFVNTTLGETWEEETGEKLEWEVIASRREVWEGDAPVRALYLTVGVDVQDDRFEYEITAWGANEESWVVEYGRLYGNLDRQEIWDRLKDKLNSTFAREDGLVMDIALVCIDSGGHYTDEVYKFCRQDPARFIPIKGANVYGKPIANFPRKRNRQRVYLTEVGTDNAKDVLYSRLAMVPTAPDVPTPGYRHHPVADWGDDAYFKGLTIERKKVVFLKGQRVYRWECPEGARNEPTDCAVYSLAAVRIGQQHFGFNLNQQVKTTTKPKAKPAAPETQQPPAPPAARDKAGGWLNVSNTSGWL